MTYDELLNETSADQSKDSTTRIAIDGYSLLLTRDYIFVAKRAREDKFNSISFSGIAFAKNRQIADEIESAGLYELLR